MKPYFDRDGITIYHADCADILPEIDPATVGLLLTDPPYGIAHNTDYTRFASKHAYVPVAGDNQPFDPAPLFRFPRLALFGADRYYHRLPPGGSWVIWIKRTLEHLATADDIPLSSAEALWHNLSGRPIDLFPWYWHGAYRQGEMGSHLHPTQKPVALMRWLIEKWTKPGDLVLDPYMGSGPIAQACLELGRRYIGIEIDEDYCRVTVEHRLGQATLPYG